MYHMVKETRKILIKNCFLVAITIQNDGNSGDSKVRMIAGNVGCSGDVGTNTFKFKEYSVLEFACKLKVELVVTVLLRNLYYLAHR